MAPRLRALPLFQGTPVWLPVTRSSSSRDLAHPLLASMGTQMAHVRPHVKIIFKNDVEADAGRQHTYTSRGGERGERETRGREGEGGRERLYLFVKRHVRQSFV